MAKARSPARSLPKIPPGSASLQKARAIPLVPNRGGPIGGWGRGRSAGNQDQALFFFFFFFFFFLQSLASFTSFLHLKVLPLVSAALVSLTMSFGVLMKPVSVDCFVTSGLQDQTVVVSSFLRRRMIFLEPDTAHITKR